MPRRVSPSQLKSMIRQLEAKQRQAVSELRKAQRAIDNYNREARAHNARVRANQQRLRAEFARFNNQRSSTRFISTQTSTIALHTAFYRVEQASDAGVWDVG